MVLAIVIVGALAALAVISVVVARRAADRELAMSFDRRLSVAAQRDARGGFRAGAVLGAVAGLAASIVGIFNPPAGAAIALGAGALAEAA